MGSPMDAVFRFLSLRTNSITNKTTKRMAAIPITTASEFDGMWKFVRAMGVLALMRRSIDTHRSKELAGSLFVKLVDSPLVGMELFR